MVTQYDAVSFAIGVAPESGVAVLEFTISDGQKIAIGVSGESFEHIAEAILRVLDEHPEIRTWRSAPRN